MKVYLISLKKKKWIRDQHRNVFHQCRLGGRILLEKLQQYRPKIAVFNGKGIYEVFSGKKEFTFGKQPECIDGTNTVSFVSGTVKQNLRFLYRITSFSYFFFFYTTQEEESFDPLLSLAACAN